MTNRILHDLVQGTPEWHAFRASHHGASEAAAMLGLDPYTSRSELMRRKYSGVPADVSPELQVVFDRGHATEAAALPIIQAILGEELYPVVYSMGNLSASCDGLTLDGDMTMEHKQYNRALFDSVSAGAVPVHHLPQCHQVMLVTGATCLCFVVSDGTEANMAYAFVRADPAWQQRIIDGWAQFDRDLADYTPPPEQEPTPVGRPPESLPALRIELVGQVTASNLQEFKSTALTAIRAVNRSLTTDQDFADAERSVKWCGEVESRLAAAKEHALSQTASIDALFKTIDEIGAEARRVRLDLEKLVTRRKSELREASVIAGRRALDAHIASLNAEIAPIALPAVAVDFACAMKGKRSMASIEDAIATELARAKIAADAAALALRANLATFTAMAAGYEFLFSDLSQLAHKPADDFRLALQVRIDRHKAMEAEKAAEKAKLSEEAAKAMGAAPPTPDELALLAAVKALLPPLPAIGEDYHVESINSIKLRIVANADALAVTANTEKAIASCDAMLYDLRTLRMRLLIDG